MVKTIIPQRSKALKAGYNEYLSKLEDRPLIIYRFEAFDLPLPSQEQCLRKTPLSCLPLQNFIKYADPGIAAWIYSDTAETWSRVVEKTCLN